MTSKPLTLLGLECVLQHMEANTRFHLTLHCPSLRSLDKRIPLKINSLKLEEFTFTVNDIKYRLGIYQKYPDHLNIPAAIILENETGGIQKDSDVYGEKVAGEDMELTPGDLMFEKHFTHWDATDDPVLLERKFRRRLQELKSEIARREEQGIYIEHGEYDYYMNNPLMFDYLEEHQVMKGFKEDAPGSKSSQSGEGSVDTVPDSMELNRVVGEEEDEVVPDSYEPQPEKEDTLSEQDFCSASFLESCYGGYQPDSPLSDEPDGTITEPQEPQDTEPASERASVFLDLPTAPPPVFLSPLPHFFIIPPTLDTFSYHPSAPLSNHHRPFRSELLPFQLKRDNLPPPWEHLLQLTITKSDGDVQVHRGKYNIKLGQAMKMIYSFIFGARKLPTLVDKLHIESSIHQMVLRLPAGLKFRVRMMDCEGSTDNYLNALCPIIDDSSNPLEHITTPSFAEHPMVLNARSLAIESFYGREANTEYFLRLNSLKFFMKFSADHFHASDCIPIIQSWLEKRKNVGTCFKFAMRSEEMDVLIGMRNRFNGTRTGPKSISIPMRNDDGASELRVSYLEREENDQPVFQMEVVESRR